MPESPRFLLANNRISEGKEVFRRIAQWNGVEFPETVTFAEQRLETVTICSPLRQIWADPILKKNLMAASFLWMVSSFNWYMLSFYLKYFPGNIFQNSLYFAISDFIGYFLVGVIMRYLTVAQGYRVA